jgi:indole-3-acetate monooxygenase
VVPNRRAARGERERHLSKVILDGLRDAALLGLLTPQSLGGRESDPVTVARVIEHVAGHDSAAGWALMIGDSADW